jgi:hypothetical protein
MNCPLLKHFSQSTVRIFSSRDPSSASFHGRSFWQIGVGKASRYPDTLQSLLMVAGLEATLSRL